MGGIARRDRYMLAMLHGFNGVHEFPLRTQASWIETLESTDPEIMAQLYDFRLEVADVLELFDIELAEMRRIAQAAFEEGKEGGTWETSKAKARLMQIA